MKWALFLLGVFVVLGGLWLFRTFDKTHFDLISQTLKPDRIKSFINDAGPWGIAAYVLLFTLNVIVILPPIAILALLAGAFLGPVQGMIALCLGTFCGTTATFFISRTLGRKFMEKRLMGKYAQFNEKLTANGFWVLLPMRLTGFPRYEIVNYLSGLSKISYRNYISATMAGLAPTLVVQVLLSDRIARSQWKDPVLWAVIIAWVVFVIATVVILKKKEKK